MIIIPRGSVGRISRVFMIICVSLSMLIVGVRVMVCSFGLSGWKEGWGCWDCWGCWDGEVEALSGMGLNGFLTLHYWSFFAFVMAG